MAQQYRELGSSGAASRQVANLNQGQFTPDESTSNLANFAKDLGNFGGDLSAKARRDAAQEERENKIQDDIDQKRADSEKTRLRVEAQRKLIESGGENWETAHGAEGVKAGEAPIGGKDTKGNRVKNKSNADVVNPVYKKEYELAFTKRKVDKFQNSLNNRADTQVNGFYAVWEAGYNKEGHPANGLSFKDFAVEALTNQKDDWYKNELSMLPHFGEFADKVNYAAHEKKIAELDQGFRDTLKGKGLADAVNDHNEKMRDTYGTDGLPLETIPQQGPRERNQNKQSTRKPISAVSNLLSSIEELRGTQVDDNGVKRGIYTYNEVHGAFIKDFNDKLLLCNSVNCPVFKSLESIFESPDVHRLLELDPNTANGIGTKYGNLKEEYDKRYNQVTTDQESKNSETSKQIKEDHTRYINNIHATARNLKLQGAKGELDESQIALLERKLLKTHLYDRGDQQFLDDVSDLLIELRNPTVTTKVIPLTKEEQIVVNNFTANLSTSIETLDDIGIEESKILSSNDDPRVQMAKIRALDTKEEALKTKNAGTDRKLTGFKKTSKDQSELKKIEYKSLADDIRNTERTKEGARTKKFKEFKDSIKSRKRTLDLNLKISPEDRLNAKNALDAELQSLQQEEEDYSDEQQTSSFFAFIQDAKKFNIEEVSEKNIKSLQKKIDKINNETLKMSLQTKITEIRNKRSTQESLKEDLQNLKSFDKSWKKFGSILNGVKELGSKDGLISLRGVQTNYELDKEFLEAAKLDPSKRNFLDEIVKTEKYLQDKLPEEEKEKERQIRATEIKDSEEDRNTKITTAQKFIKGLEESWSETDYDTTKEAIEATYTHYDSDGDPTELNVFPDERRLALLDRLDDSKTKSSGKVPTISSPEFNPNTFIKFEDKIKGLEGLQGYLLKDAIKDIEADLRTDYAGFKVPQQIYEDLQHELKTKIPGSPVTISPVVHGRKTIRSAFLGKFDKFDKNEEFLKLGGRTATNLYERVRKVYERKITALTKSPEFSDLSDVQKLEKAELIAGNLLNTDLSPDEGGHPDSDWRGQYKIYKLKYDEAQQEADKQEVEKEIKLSKTDTKDAETSPTNETTTDSNVKSITEYFGGYVYKNIEFQNKQENQNALELLGIKNG